MSEIKEAEVMADTREVHDPFLGKMVLVSNRLVDRLRGKYACGPAGPDGEPELGWDTFEVTPICREAADEIERLQEAKRRALAVADERAKENVALRAELERLRAQTCAQEKDE